MALVTSKLIAVKQTRGEYKWRIVCAEYFAEPDHWDVGYDLEWMHSQYGSLWHTSECYVEETGRAIPGTVRRWYKEHVK